MIILLISLVYAISTALAASSSAVPVPPAPATIIDILSSQAQYSYFLMALQRHELVPYINTLENVTLLAPINSAFAQSVDAFETKQDLLRYIVDQRFRVGYLDRREVLFNTMYTYPDNSSYTVVVSPDFDTQEYVVDHVSNIVDADIYAKHQHSFIQGIDHFLPLKPSLCDVLLSDKVQTIAGHNISVVQSLFKSLFTDHRSTELELEPNSKPKSKPKPKPKPKPKSCSDFIQGARTVFVPSNSVLEESLSQTQRNYYTALYSSDPSDHFATSSAATREISTDIVALLRHLMLPDLVGGANGTEYPTRNHTSLSKNIKYDTVLDELESGVVLNGKFTSSANFVAADGIIHVFESQESPFFTELSIPTVEIIPRKALFALHYSDFVEELHFRKLDYLIDGSTLNQSIFLDIDQRDDTELDSNSEFNQKIGSKSVFLDKTDPEIDPNSANVDVNENSEIEPKSGPFAASFNSKQGLLYQFSDEPVDISSLLDHRESSYLLLNSQLCSKRRIGSCYKLKLSATKSDNTTSFTLNDDFEVSGSYYAGNNTYIFVGDREVATPSSLKHSLGDLISNGALQRHLEHIDIDKESCLKTLGYLNEHNFYSLDDNNHGYSVFLPCGIAIEPENLMTEEVNQLGTTQLKLPGAWNRLGLVLDYLEANPKVFKHVLQGMFVEGTIYSDFGLSDNKTFNTANLRGDPVAVKNLYYDGDYDNIITLNGTKLPIPLNSDILFNQGVVHVVNQVLMPQNFEVPFVDLVETTLDGNYPKHNLLELIKLFSRLRETFNLDNQNQQLNYSLLVPTPGSLNDFNISAGFTHLWDFLQFHIIPNTEIGTLLKCMDSSFQPENIATPKEFTISTNLTNTTLICYQNRQNKAFLKLKTPEDQSEEDMDILSYNKDHEVQIVSHGCTRFGIEANTTTGGCVFLIEKPLNLEWLDLKRGHNFLHLHLGFISVGIGIILGLVIFGSVMIGGIFCIRNNRTKLDKSGITISDFRFPSTEPSFMRVTGDDSYVIDRGYETDVDVLRSESDQLLPVYGAKKYKKRGYGSIPTYPNNSSLVNHDKASAPRSIKNSRLSSGLNRDRNIPGFN